MAPEPQSNQKKTHEVEDCILVFTDENGIPHEIDAHANKTDLLRKSTDTPLLDILKNPSLLQKYFHPC